MFKKILCLAMILVMVASMAVIGVSAADTKIYFEVPSDWNNVKQICCYIWEYNAQPEHKFANWESKKTYCTLEDDGRWSYDPVAKTNNSLEPGKIYAVIFSSKGSLQTYNLLLSSACYGDTVYCDGTKFENPADSNKTAIAAYWKNQNKAVYGPIMGITSIGNVVGTVVAPGQTADGLFTAFLKETLTNARTFSGKSDQDIIDTIAKDLGLGQDTVEKLIKESGVEGIEWTKAESKAPEKDDTSKVPSNPAATATGQETTIVYIAIAMMLASAAVVFFARKKRVTE